MSSSGWGGQGQGPQDGPWQHGGPQGGQPPTGQPHGGGPQGAAYGATPPAAWQAQPPGGPGGPTGPGYGGPQGPQGPSFPGGKPPRRAPWALIGVAMTCVLAMVLVVGGGLTYLVLRQGGDDVPIASDTPAESATSSTDPATPSETESTTPADPEPTAFELAVPYDPPTGSPDELWEVMGNNPLTEGTLPTLPTCDLPETPIQPDAEELQAVLDASATCLNQVWSTASSDRGLPWVSPKIVVYTHPEVPAQAACDTDFSADFPRMCNLDSTLYWPDSYGMALELTDPANVPGAYLWDLSYVYMHAVHWNSTLIVYFQALRKQLDGTDQERFDESWRRYNLSQQCLAAAASMQVPTASEPGPALREALTDPASWNEGEAPRKVRPETRAMWTERGFESQGDLSRCNTWTVDVDQVT
ncbi:MAG: hypothetical protein ACTHWF_08615 [Brachybacterium sp.]